MNDPSRYAGLTVNERLSGARLLEAFDAAVRARHRSEMIRILMAVDVDDAAWSADIILQTLENTASSVRYPPTAPSTDGPNWRERPSIAHSCIYGVRMRR